MVGYLGTIGYLFIVHRAEALVSILATPAD